MSGECDTSLGNGWANLCVAYFLHVNNGGTEEDFDGIFEGDDALFVTTATLNPKMFEALGFKVKLQEVADPCSASFCGLIFGQSGQIIRDPLKVLCKFGWTSSFIHAGDRIMNSLLKAKCMSLLAETPDCPVLSPLAWHILQKMGAVTPKFVYDAYKPAPAQTRFRAPSICADTRSLFGQKFHISAQEQLDLERRIMNDDYDFADVLLQTAESPDDALDLSTYAIRYVATG